MTSAAELKLIYPDEQTCLNSIPNHLSDVYVNGVEDLTWNLTSDKIYFTFGDKKTAYVYTPRTGSVNVACEFRMQVEAIKILPDGDLLISTHNSSQFTKIDL